MSEELGEIKETDVNSDQQSDDDAQAQAESSPIKPPPKKMQKVAQSQPLAKASGAGG